MSSAFRFRSERPNGFVRLKVDARGSISFNGAQSIQGYLLVGDRAVLAKRARANRAGAFGARDLIVIDGLKIFCARLKIGLQRLNGVLDVGAGALGRQAKLVAPALG